MSSKDYYYTITEEGRAEYKDRGSRFIAIAVPVRTIEGCKEKIAVVKKEYPKASHYCFAYRLGHDNNTFRVSDDGEPSGTAGRPILGQIDSRQCTNILIVVVRYFGGALLGVPGLINAYKTSAALVLQVTPLVQKSVLIPYRIEFDYTQMNEIMRILKQSGSLVEKQENNLFSVMEIGIPKDRKEEVLLKLENIRGLISEALTN